MPLCEIDTVKPKSRAPDGDALIPAIQGVDRLRTKYPYPSTMPLLKRVACGIWALSQNGYGWVMMNNILLEIPIILIDAHLCKIDWIMFYF